MITIWGTLFQHNHFVIGPEAAANRESIEHIFWECPKISAIIPWIESVCKSLVSNNFELKVTFFLMGFPPVKLPQIVFNRLWYFLCISKFIIWKCRCIHIFQSRLHSSDEIKSLIIKEVKQRIRADQKRLTVTKFSKVWIKKRSFVSIFEDKLSFKLS